MADFGDVLRGLGSVLNPAVMQDVNAERARQQAAQQQIGGVLLQDALQQAREARSPQAQALRLELAKKQRAEAYFQSPQAQAHMANPDQNAGLRGLTMDLVGLGIQNPIDYLKQEIAAKKADRVVVPQGSTVIQGTTPVFTNPPKPEAPHTRTIQKGDQKVAQEFDPVTRTWNDVPGAVGPAFARQVAPIIQTGEKSKYANVQSDGKGGWVGLNKSTGKMERIPADEGVVKNESASDDVVKAIAEGRMQMPTGFALRSPYWQDVVERVQKLDPKFDASRYGARAAARRTFASGPEARNVTSLNTVIGHLGTLDEMATALDNKDLMAYNAVANRLATQIGRPEANNYNIARQAVAEETMRVFRQVGASEKEAERWGNLLSSSGSPRQLRENIATVGKLLDSRVEAIGQQYERTVNEKDNPARVDPKNRAALDRMSGGAAQPGLPDMSAIDAEIARRKAKK